MLSVDDPKGWREVRLLMKTINVDRLPEPVVRAMKVVVETLREQFRAEEEAPVDPSRVRAAILARRKESRELNRDWGSVDREVWNAKPETSR
jgi:hypothetical protein